MAQGTAPTNQSTLLPLGKDRKLNEYLHFLVEVLINRKTFCLRIFSLFTSFRTRRQMYRFSHSHFDEERQGDDGNVARLR